MTYWFSYETMIAFQAGNADPVVRRNDWGPTTGKHLNRVDGGGAAAKAARVDKDAFNKALMFAGFAVEAVAA